MDDQEWESGYNIALILPNAVTCDMMQECVVIVNASLPKHIKFFVRISTSGKSSFVRADKINDTALKFQTPANFPAGAARISIHYTENQNILCRYKQDFYFESKIDLVQDLLKTTSDPVSFLADSLSIRDKDDGVAVDFKLEKCFRKNRPANFHLLTEKNISTKNSTNIKSSRNPTLLHFAARYNFVRLCLALVDSPGGKEALNLQNADGLFPHDLAKQCENHSLARILQETKDHDQNSKHDSKYADEIYEQMSSEIFEHYKQVKKSFKIRGLENSVSSDDNEDDLYEYMSETSSIDSSSYNDRFKIGLGLDVTRSCSVPDISRGIQGVMVNGNDAFQRNIARSSPFMQELKKRSDQKSSPSLTSTTPPRPNKPLPKRSSSSFDETDATNDPHDIYDTLPPSRSKSGTLVEDNVYDTPPGSIDQDNIYDTPPGSANKDNIYDTPPTNADSLYDFPSPPFRLPTPVIQSPVVETKDSFDIYDTPSPVTSKSSENKLYISVSNFNREDIDDTYDTLPPPKSVVADTRSLDGSGYDTYDTLPARDNMTGYIDNAVDDTYDVPGALRTNGLPLRNSSSHHDLSQTSSSRPHGLFNSSLAFDGRKGKRHSEPVIQSFTTAERQKLLRSQQAAIQRSNLPLPVPPRNPANQAPKQPKTNGVPKPGPRPSQAPPLPPQRVPKR